MSIDDKVAQAMRLLETNVAKASANPDAVLQGSFSATSGSVTVWVDSLGRTERYRIAPNSVSAGDELFLIEALESATQEARRKAEHLEFDEASAPEQARPATESPGQRPAWDEGFPTEGGVDVVALSRFRACVCVGVAVAASCSPPAQGYRDDPGACSVLSDASIVEQLGPEAVDGPNTADTGGGNDRLWSRCEWESFHPPRWGSPANASIEVTVQVSTTEDGEPDAETARERFRYSELPGEIPDSPPDVIGDASRHKFLPSETGSQRVKVDVLRANAHITVEYLGWGDRDHTRYYLPRELQERPTRDMAREVLHQLGPPR